MTKLDNFLIFHFFDLEPFVHTNYFLEFKHIIFKCTYSLEDKSHSKKYSNGVG